jgi:hypothetical protein
MASFLESKFAEILQFLSTTPPEQSKQERRRAPRTPCSVKLHVLPLIDGKQQPGFQIQVIDVSMRGIGFRMNIDQVIGDHFVIYLPVPGGALVPTHARVAHCRPHPDGGLICGAEFLGTVGEPAPSTAHSDATMQRIRSSILD